MVEEKIKTFEKDWESESDKIWNTLKNEKVKLSKEQENEILGLVNKFDYEFIVAFIKLLRSERKDAKIKLLNNMYEREEITKSVYETNIQELEYIEK